MSNNWKMPNNWKSAFAFLTFIIIYGYSVLSKSSAEVINITGYIALYSSLFMMLRSEVTSGMLQSVLDRIKFDKK